MEFHLTLLEGLPLAPNSNFLSEVNLHTTLSLV